MNRFKNKAFYIFTLGILMIGCSTKTATVIVDKTDLSSGKVTIDDTLHREFSDSLIRVELKVGNHFIKGTDGIKKDFYVKENGGLLNLDNQEFVAYEIEYSDPANKEKFTINSISVKAIILIDSFIISPAMGISFRSDSMLKIIAPKILKAKNGNYQISLGKAENDYDTNENVSGLKKFGKDKLYIDKFWDYDFGQEIPDELSVKVTESEYSIVKASKNKIAIMPARNFLMLAKLSPDLFFVKHINELFPLVNKSNK